MDSSLDNNGKPKKCETCGCSEEVEGDFVVYQFYRTSRTYFQDARQINETMTNYNNIKYFPFGACIQCTRTKLLADIKLWKKTNQILLYITLAGIIGIQSRIYFPNLSTGRSVSDLIFFFGIGAFIVWASSSYWLRKKCEELLKGLPSDRAKVSEAILIYSNKRILKYAHSLNPTIYKNIKEDSRWFGSRDYVVVSKHEWETKISPNRDKINNSNQKD